MKYKLDIQIPLGGFVLAIACTVIIWLFRMGLNLPILSPWLFVPIIIWSGLTTIAVVLEMILIIMFRKYSK